jgi:hypothetical protein
MGTYYIDRARMAAESPSCSIDARNAVGKWLKDQTLDEATLYPKDLLSFNIVSMLVSAGLVENEHFKVQPTSVYEVGMLFPRRSTYLQALEEWVATAQNWVIKERLDDGMIVVGSTVSYAEHLPANSKYSFARDTEVISRGIERDDMGSYSRVCVTATYKDPVTEEMLEQAVYETIAQANENWTIGTKKTLYVAMPEETPTMELQEKAVELAGRLATAGTIETFIGPIRPQLLPGDEAEIVSTAGTKLVGTITNVAHRFGRGGYLTEFTVDSGGRLGKPTITDYINMISTAGQTTGQAKRTF